MYMTLLLNLLRKNYGESKNITFLCHKLDYKKIKPIDFIFY